MKKKASLLDIFPIMIILFMTVLVLIISYLVWSSIDSSKIFYDDVPANESMKQTQKALLAYDNLTLMIFIMMSAVTIVLASQIASHPAWFFISLIVLIIAVIVAVIISNAYEDVRTSEQLSEAASNFPKTNFLLDKLPIYIILMMFSIAVAMYAGYKLM